MKAAAIALCGVSMLALATTARAQTADTAAPAGSASVGEIVVTAQRRSERLQDVPITITNIDAKQLANVNATSVSDIMQLTPALRFDFIGGVGTQVTIRGVGTDLIGPGVGSNVGIYVDGFYQANLEGADFQLLNITNVDVLKGPQGTLFGRNTSAGAIQITTSKPSHENNLIVEGQYGSYNAGQVSLYGTAGLSDKVAVDLGAIYSGGNGYFTNIVDNNHDIGRYQKWTIRPGIMINFTPDFSVLFRYEHSYNSDPTVSLYNSPVVGGFPQTVGAIIPGNVTTTDPTKVSYAIYPPIKLVTTIDNYQLTMTEDLHFATLTSYTQYHTDNNSDYSSLSATGPFDAAHTLFVSPESLFTQELLLSSKGDSRLQYTAGFFYMDFKQYLNAFYQSGPVLPVVSFSGPTNDFAGGSGAEYLSYAVYADATYRVLDWLYLTGGLRYTHDVAQNIFNHTVANGESSVPSLHSDRITPRAVIRIEPNKDNSLYFSYTQGYKAQIPDLGDPTNTPVKPEEITAYEVGYKYTHGPVRLDLSSYYYDWKDIQVSRLIFIPAMPPIPAQTITVTQNAAAATVYGVEGQLYYAITPNFNVNVGGAYTHARYDSFANAPGYQDCVVLACGLGFGTQVNINVNAKGFSLPRSPDFTATLGAVYTTPVFNGDLALSGNLYYTTKIFFDPANQYAQNAYATLALRAEWTDPSKRYTFAVFGNNVTNTHYVNQVLESQVAIEQGWAAPATYGVSVRINLR